MRWVRWLALCVATGLVVLLAVAVAVEAARRPAEAVGDGGRRRPRAPGRRGGRALVRGPAAGAAAGGTRLRVASGRCRPGSAGGCAAATTGRRRGALRARVGARADGARAGRSGRAPAPDAGASSRPHDRRRRGGGGGGCGARAVGALRPAGHGLLRMSAQSAAPPRGRRTARRAPARRPGGQRRGVRGRGRGCCARPRATTGARPARRGAGRRPRAGRGRPGAAMLAHHARAGSPALDATTRTLWLLLCGALLLAAAGVASEAVRVRLLRRRVATHVVAALPAGDELQAALAAALDDPALRVVFVTGSGCASTPPVGRPARPLRASSDRDPCWR